MLVVTDHCTIKTLLITNPEKDKIVKFEIDTNKYPNQKILLGKKIGDIFQKSDLSSRFIADQNLTYEIIDIQTRLSEKTSELMNILQKYKFEGFIHTTEIENFKSILKCGFLIPRIDLINNGINFKDSAEIGVLEKTTDFVKKCCRFYYYYKTPTNYIATKEGKYKDPLIIVYNKKLAYKSNVFFCPENAQRGIIKTAEEALYFDWEGIFERGDRRQSKYCSCELNDEITKKISHIRNAEFLVQGNVSIEYIHKICVSSQRQYDLLKSFCSDEIMKKVVKESDKFDKIF
ncbi:MAG: DUF4433 domain-containing protein [Clostridia bacterium]|nr:DUF4433 domain-containing protein [Clostridia bacterium]